MSELFAIDSIDRQALYERLFPLLIRQAALYTQGDSDSLPVERAEQLLDSVCYTLKLYLDKTGQPASVLITGDLQSLLEKAQASLAEEYDKVKRLYQLVRDNRAVCGNRAYRDTVYGIGAFFVRYDLRMAAQETPCDIDYPLCVPVSERLRGVGYIGAYLTRLLAESLFLNRFPKSRVLSLLRADCLDPEGLLINLYEPVLRNALGRALLGGDILALSIDDAERALLMKRLSQDTNGALMYAADTLKRALSVTAPFEKEYMNLAALSLAPRIRAASDDLRHLFVWFTA